MPSWYASHQFLANSILLLLLGSRLVSRSFPRFQRVTKCSLPDRNPFSPKEILEINLLSCNWFQLSSLWMNPQLVSQEFLALKVVNEALLCSNMWTPKFKAQRTNAFFASVNEICPVAPSISRLLLRARHSNREAQFRQRNSARQQQSYAESRRAFD